MYSGVPALPQRTIQAINTLLNSDRYQTEEAKQRFESLVNTVQGGQRREQNPQFKGFEFDGVQCSATRQDQRGIMAMAIGFQMGIASETQFKFTNGSMLEVDSDNIGRLEATFAEFRELFAIDDDGDEDEDEDRGRDRGRS